MPIFLFVYGTCYHAVRVGFTGQRPLIYGLYAYDNQEQLPFIHGQTYRSITVSQFEWLRQHLDCDVSFVPGAWVGRVGNLECLSHDVHYHLFNEDDPILLDIWEERQI